MRTAEPAGSHRMDFTRRQFWRGAWAAWGIFMISLTIALILPGLLTGDTSAGDPFALSLIFLVYGIPIGGVVALGAMIVGSPVAWLLGRLLVRSDIVSVHLIVYAALGGCVGAAVLAIASLGRPAGSAMTQDPFVFVFAFAVIGVCAASVAGGWYWTFRRSVAERAAPELAREGFSAPVDPERAA